MLSPNQNAILTDVMPGAPMHEAMARYWLPALLSRDLPEPDSDPLSVKLLGRDFVAFRDTAGRVGLLNEHCCHRSASLCLGRVEGGGVRCLYHGWKYDVDGNVLEMPNVSDERIKARIKQPAYPVREAGGIVWAYLGPRELEPPFPEFDFLDLPLNNTFVEIVVASANYTRLLEGVLDSSHTGVLHTDAIADVRAGKGPAPVLGGHTRAAFGAAIAENLAPRLEVQETDFGLRYAAIRDLVEPTGEASALARVSTFSFPACVFSPPDNILLFAVPVHNDLTNFYMIYWDPYREIGSGEALRELRSYYGIDDVAMDYWGLDRRTHHLPDRPNRANNYRQDRGRMRRGESFTGLHRFIPEDFAMAMSMGPIAHRPHEHLVHADLAIVRYRRLLIDNATRIRDGGEPIGLAPRHRPRAVAGYITPDRPWTALFTEDQADLETAEAK
jgi:phthalate 4,5-dioxygenase